MDVSAPPVRWLRPEVGSSEVGFAVDVGAPPVRRLRLGIVVLLFRVTINAEEFIMMFAEGFVVGEAGVGEEEE